MYISARERKILERLLETREDTTVKEIALLLEVSSRTVHRDLKGVEEVLQEYELELNKKSGIGIGIVGDEDKKEKLQLFLYNLSHNEYTPEERQTIILASLLDTREPVKLLSLANDLNVTIATISNDLNKVEERIEPFQLSLLRKRGYGVEINGSESNKRKAMSKLILDQLDEYEFISIIKENIQKKSAQSLDTITDRLLGLVDKKKLLIIEKQIDDIKEELPYSIADSAYIGLVVHLALAIERIQQGEEINFDEETLRSLEGTKEYKVAKKIVVGLEEVFRITISTGEIGYITMHLMGAKLRNDHGDLFEDTHLHVGITAQKLIRYVSNGIGYDLTNNASLFQGLVAHLRPALYRLKQNMGISNPLLPRIQQDYLEMFEVIEKGVQEILPELKIPKEEIGYLVMHFASAMLNKGEQQEIHTLVVCSSGIGTSKILSTKLQQEIPGLKTVNASLFDLTEMDTESYDMIVSTIPLKNFKGDYFVVSPLLTVEEIGKIKKYLVDKQHDIGTKKQSVMPIKRNTLSADQFLSEIIKIRNYSASICTILEGFKVSEISMASTLEKALEEACKNLETQLVLEDSHIVLEELKKRESIGGLGIPGTSLSLYHTKSDVVLVPSFTIIRLNQKITVKAMDDTDIKIDTILLMLSPLNTNSETLELLSGISSLIIRDEETIEAFQTKDEKELRTIIATEFKELFEHKTYK